MLLLGLLASGAVFAEAYKWVDADGVVHFSDRPQPGAERIELPTDTPGRPRPTTAYSSAATTSAAANDADGETTEPFVRYSTIEIASPAAEETLWNIGGELEVAVNLQPGLQPGHQLRIYFDGSPRVVNSTRFRLEEVWRGVHNLQAEVIDQSGEVVSRSQPNRFYVQQNSIL